MNAETAAADAPQVTFRLLIDLTQSSDPIAQVQEQARFTPRGTRVDIRLGHQLGPVGLERAIAEQFFIAASEITISGPDAYRGTWFASNVHQHVRQLRNDLGRASAN
ncbi:hypothetical protein [Streptomyces carpaticus]|uniref:hypothetical protein n=1 Tax=Streptomyces carpaticus TaxID=285558 RepID=UPI0031F7FDDA